MSAKRKIKDEFRIDGYRSYDKLLADVQNKYGTEDVQIKKEEYKKGFIFKKRYYSAIVRILEDEVDKEEEQKKLFLTLMEEVKELKKEICHKNKQDSSSLVLEQVRRDVKKLSNSIDIIKDKSNYSDEVRSLEKYLKRQNVEEDTINKIIKGVIYDCSNDELKNIDAVFDSAKQQVYDMFRNIKGLDMNSKKQKIIMLVGPTGVGKTTSITKLSTYLKQVKRKDVGLITLDTYREGAIAQLTDLCDYTNIDVEVANNKVEFEKCLSKFALKDFIFIDTAGRSQYDLSEIRKLYTTTNSSNIDEVYLVLSSSTKYRDMLEIYNSYKDLNVNRIILSKIDETREYGNLLSFVDKVNNVPLSYLTTGQEVPNDIEKVRESKMVELIFKDEDSLSMMM